VESAHAVAALPDVLARLAVAGAEEGSGGTTPRGAAPAAPAPLPREAVIVLGLSGRGDKDLAALADGQSRAALGLKEVGR
jgi:hypothetical protein